MKNARIVKVGIGALLAAFLFGASLNLKAQEEEMTEEKSYVSAGADIVNAYVWRGTKFAGPSIQPYVDFGFGGLSVGAWGSYDYDNTFGAEADLYLSYSTNFGLSLGVTDYYYPGTKYFDYSDSSGAHAFEVNLGYEISGFSISANYIINEAGAAGSDGGDMYFELGYAITDNIGVFAGGGNGWHTDELAAGEDPNKDGAYDDVFSVVNVGFTGSSEVKMSETYSLPVSGALILNPYTEQFHVVVGFSL